jgi:hypothetical protein
MGVALMAFRCAPVAMIGSELLRGRAEANEVTHNTPTRARRKIQVLMGKLFSLRSLSKKIASGLHVAAGSPLEWAISGAAHARLRANRN